jgi:hypothetical protein
VNTSSGSPSSSATRWSIAPKRAKGQPQARHLHGLLATGLEVMTRFFPDLPQALKDHGAIMGDFADTMQWYTYGGYRKRFKMNVPATLMSRPLLEHLVRERVLALPNVALVDNCGVLGLVTAASTSLSAAFLATRLPAYKLPTAHLASKKFSTPTWW